MHMSDARVGQGHPADMVCVTLRSLSKPGYSVCKLHAASHGGFARLRTIGHKYVSAAHGLASHYVHIRASACMAAPCITNMRARMHGCVAATASLARDGGRRAAVLAQLQRIGQVMDLAMAPHVLCCVLCCEPSCVCGLVLR